MHLIIMVLSFFDCSLSNPERLNVPQTSWKNISDIYILKKVFMFMVLVYNNLGISRSE